MRLQMNAQIKKKLNAWRHTELEVIRTIKKLGACTDHQIAKALGIGHKWAGQKRKILYEAGRIYISGYTRVSNRGPVRVIYSWRYEDEVDEPMPQPLTSVQRTLRYRSRLKYKNLLQLMKGNNHVTAD